jgi:hypothetical protein
MIKEFIIGNFNATVILDAVDSQHKFAPLVLKQNCVLIELVPVGCDERGTNFLCCLVDQFCYLFWGGLS